MSKENVAEILSLLRDANKKLETTVETISDPNVLLRPLNANHMKNILKASVEGFLENNQFTLIFYRILKEITDKNLNDLNIVDKNIILLKLREQNFKDTLNITLKNGDDSIKHEIKIKNFLIDKIKKIKKEYPEQPIVVSEGDFKLELNFPSIEEEYQFESHIYKSVLSKIKTEDESSMKHLIAPLLISQITRHIKKLVIGEREINLCSKPVEERLAIVEPLGGRIIPSSIEKIDNVLGKPLEILSKIEVTQDDIIYKSQIEFGTNLFV